MFNFLKSGMQINNQHNSLYFTSLNCPIKPFIIKTQKGDLYCSEMDYTKKHNTGFYKKIGKFFLDIFANTSKHPFWEKCRKPKLDKYVYDDYINSSMAEYKKFFAQPDTTVLFVKNKRNSLVGAIYTRVLDLSDKLRDSDTLYVDSLAIKPNYRGLDIGKAVMNKVLEESKDKFSQVFLVAYKESTPFYEKLNFTKMNSKDTAQKYAIKKLSDVRIDYPKYVDFLQKDLGKKLPDSWYERVKNNK